MRKDKAAVMVIVIYYKIKVLEIMRDEVYTGSSNTAISPLILTGT